MITFKEYVFESEGESCVEVNVFFESSADKKAFVKKIEKEGFVVEFGKNKYADTAKVYGVRKKVVRLLKTLGFADEEIVVRM